MSDKTFSPADPISSSEATAITGLPWPLIEALLTGPNEGASLTLRSALSIGMLAELAMLAEPEHARNIAAQVAAEAEPHGKRLFAVGWANNQPHGGWVPAVTNELRRTVLVIPGEKTFNDLAARLVAFRRDRARLN